MKVLHRRENHIEQPAVVDCRKCGSTLEVNQGEWQVMPGDRSSLTASCPVCGGLVFKPGGPR